MSISSLKNLSASGVELADFGKQPVSNRFLTSSNLESPKFDIKLRINEDTGLVHLDSEFPTDELKPRYDWLTCFEPEDHLDDMVEKILALPNVHKDSIFGAYSFKDDTTLTRIKNKGYLNTWRLDPVTDLKVTDVCANVETYQAVLNVDLAKQIILTKEPADVLIVRHVIEHSNDLPEFIASMVALTKPNGYIVWELPDCERAFKKGDCTTIWEEHTYYFTSFTFSQMLQQAGLNIVHFESVPYPFENSIVAIVKLGEQSVDEPVDQQTVQQQVKLANNFVDLIKQRKLQLIPKLTLLKQQYKTIALFGAGHLSVAFLSIMGVTDLIDFVIDDNVHKKGMFMPVGGLEIVGSESLYSANVGLCLLSLNPQNQPKVLAKHKQFTDKGGVFASIFPNDDLDILKIL